MSENNWQGKQGVLNDLDPVLHIVELPLQSFKEVFTYHVEFNDINKIIYL